jgi:cobalamin biosynthesis protein CobD/CbiB
VVMFLLVSCLSWMFQLLAFIRLAARRARTPTEELVSGGYLRTVACRVLAATVYVVVAATQLAGSGTLSAEALVVFTSIQLLWQLNSVMDVRIRRSLSRGEPPDAAT